MKRMIFKSILGVFAVVAVAVPVTSYAMTQTNSVRVDGAIWRDNFPVGRNVCAAVSRRFGSCNYVRYNANAGVHVVTTSPAAPTNPTTPAVRQDRLIVKDQNDQIIEDFKVPAGTDHRQAVADKRGITRADVQWISGDTENDRDYQYEAILLVITGPTTPVTPTKDRIIVKNGNKETIADFMITSGVDHIDAVAERLNVSRNAVEWLSGDTEFGREYGYEAILLVR